MKILIIEDEKTISRALSYSLQRLGHEIIESQNPAEALSKPSIRETDLIILDLNMPVISGIEFLQILEQQGSKIPVIILTSEAEHNRKILKKSKLEINLISKDLSLDMILEKIKMYYPKK